MIFSTLSIILLSVFPHNSHCRIYSRVCVCVAVGLHGGWMLAGSGSEAFRFWSQQLKPSAFAKPTEEDESRGRVWRLGGETNAIKVNQQPELIEIKDQKRGHREGGRERRPGRGGKTQRWGLCAGLICPHGCSLQDSQEYKTTYCCVLFGLKTILLQFTTPTAKHGC